MLRVIVTRCCEVIHPSGVLRACSLYQHLSCASQFCSTSHRASYWVFFNVGWWLSRSDVQQLQRCSLCVCMCVFVKISGSSACESLSKQIDHVAEHRLFKCGLRHGAARRFHKLAQSLVVPVPIQAWVAQNWSTTQHQRHAAKKRSFCAFTTQRNNKSNNVSPNTKNLKCRRIICFALVIARYMICRRSTAGTRGRGGVGRVERVEATRRARAASRSFVASGPRTPAHRPSHSAKNRSMLQFLVVDSAHHSHSDVA